MQLNTGRIRHSPADYEESIFTGGKLCGGFDFAVEEILFQEEQSRVFPASGVTDKKMCHGRAPFC